MKEITIPGACHHWRLNGPVEDREAWVTPNGGTMHAEGSLLLGRAPGATTAARLDCDDPEFWDQIAAHAITIAAWLRAQAGDPVFPLTEAVA